MARYKDISQKPRLRARLRVSAIILMILGAALPYLFMITFGFANHTRQEETLDASLTSQAQEQPNQCYEAQVRAEEKNIFGFAPVQIDYVANWCVQDGQITELRGQKTSSNTRLGWSLGESESSVTGDTLTINQQLDYDFLSLNRGYSQIIEFTVSPDRQAKVVKRA